MFKVQEIREIIRLIDQSSISEFTYENDGATLSIKKEVKNSNEQTIQLNEKQVEVVATPAEDSVAVEKTAFVEKEIPKQQALTEAIAENDENVVEIVSPMVGTFYRKPSPESDPYIEIGDAIEESTIVCIVEAMKLFNEIEAETSGEIIDVLVEDGELVEYGQPLFKVKLK